jgi:hypothetical protein
MSTDFYSTGAVSSTKFQHSENSCYILYQTPSQVKWEPYNKLHVSNYKNVHYDVVSNVMVMQVNTCENTFFSSE